MAQGSVFVMLVATAAAIGLSGAVGAAEQSALAVPGEAPPQVERLSDTQVRAELQRLTTLKVECNTQARQALAAQQNATAVGRPADADAQRQTLWTGIRCLELANQGLLQLRNHVTPDQVRRFSLEDTFHQEYRQGLQSHLAVLQRLSEQLADQSAFTVETFGKQMETFSRQRDAFLDRFIRLLNDPETQPLALTLFQAGDLLIHSARVWTEQVKAAAEIAQLKASGSNSQLSRAEAARAAAVTERTREWEKAQHLVRQAGALAAMR